MLQFPMYFPPGFDVARARELAYLVEQAYYLFTVGDPRAPWQPPPDGMKVQPSEYTDVLVFNGVVWEPRLWDMLFRRKTTFGRPGGGPEIFGFVAQRGADIFLVFRGTKSPADWFEDAKIDQSPLPDDMIPTTGLADWSEAKVEAGVLIIYRTLRRAVLDRLATCGPPCRLYVTGHSLGACLAMLSVSDLIKNTAFTGRYSPVFYTFGQPRTGNRAFAAAIKAEGSEGYRIVHTEDIVPAMLPAGPIGRFAKRRELYYAHAGVPVDFTVLQGDQPDPKLLADNHSMDTYRAAMWTE